MQPVTSAEETSVTQSSSSGWRKAEPIIRRLLILAILFGQIAYHFSRANSYLETDLWWHLASGRWIVQHETVPATDPFSQYGHDRPWTAYTWLFDVISLKVHQNFGLLGIEYLKAILALLFGLTLYCLLQKLVGSFGFGALLTALVLAACLPLATPRPWLFTILFFSVELALLTNLRNRGRTRAIWILPLLFALWANLHVQFIYGFVLIGFFLVEGLAQRFWRGTEGYTGTWSSARLYALILVLCAGAVCVNPYGLSIYRTVWEYANQSGIYLLIQDLSPPNFRSPTHWIFIVLVLGGALVIGQSRTRSVLPYLLLLFGVFAGLRMQRDVWLGALAGAVILAGWPAGRRIITRDDEWVPGFKSVLAVVVISFIIVPFVWPQKQAELQRQVGNYFPVEAVRFVSSRSEAGPLFNDFGWGGYLIWTLPGMRVSIDGRTNVHSVPRVARSYLTWSGNSDWASDPDLQRARLILAPRTQALVSILRLHPGYRVIYEDGLAVVFEKIAERSAR